MAGTPIPLTTDGSGPEGAIPVTISGPAGSAPAFNAVPGSVSGVSGGNLQEILEDLASRLAAVETA